jgi:hypothetical protein
MGLDPGLTRVRRYTVLAVTSLVLFALSMVTQFVPAAQGTVVFSEQKISDLEGNFTGVLDDDDRLSAAITNIGDFDHDGVVDIAVGAANDDDGGENRGAVWLMFLNTDGTVKRHQKISDTEGGFTGTLIDFDRFCRVTSLGDLDDDGVTDLAVGAVGDDDGHGSDRGAVWILFLEDSTGTVKGHQKISDTEGGFDGILGDGDFFGWSTAALPDLDSDGNPELAVGARYHDDGASNAGAVWILFLADDGTVKSSQEISAAEGGFDGQLDENDYFGETVGSIGDLDGDGVPDLAVGAWDDDGAADAGAVWILFLNANGTVKAHQKISATEGNFAGNLLAGDTFSRVIPLPDMNFDGTADLAVGAHNADDGGNGRGVVWIVFLDSDGKAQGRKKIRNPKPPFTGPNDLFGFSGAWLGDLDGDGFGDLAVGALYDDDGGVDRGAVWNCFLGDVASAVPDVASPRGLSFAASPNPFRGEATLRYRLQSPSAVRLSIYAAHGRRVATLVDLEQGAGFHSAVWSGRNDTGVPVGAGIYFARLEAAGGTQVRKVVLLR